MNDKKDDKKQVDKLTETAKKIDKPEIKEAIDKKLNQIKSDKPVNK